MYPVIDLRLRPPYKSFATTSFYQNQENAEAKGPNLEQLLNGIWI